MENATHRNARLHSLQRAAEGGPQDPIVQAVVGRILSTLRSDLGRQPSRREAAQRLLDALGELVAYDPDPTGEEVIRAPPLVLERRRGDAEDLVVVFVAMCRCADIEADAAWLDQPQQAFDHVFARIKVGDEWLDAETTLRGARLGEGPYEAARRLAGSGSGAEGGPWRRGRSP